MGTFSQTLRHSEIARMQHKRGMTHGSESVSLRSKWTSPISHVQRECKAQVHIIINMHVHFLHTALASASHSGLTVRWCLSKDTH